MEQKEGNSDKITFFPYTLFYFRLMPLIFTALICTFAKKVYDMKLANIFRLEKKQCSVVDRLFETTVLQCVSSLIWLLMILILGDHESYFA